MENEIPSSAPADCVYFQSILSHRVLFNIISTGFIIVSAESRRRIGLSVLIKIDGEQGANVPKDDDDGQRYDQVLGPHPGLQQAPRSAVAGCR